MSDETPVEETPEETPVADVPADVPADAPLPPPPPVMPPPPPGAPVAGVPVGPAPVRAKVVWPMRTKVVVLGGAVLMLLGSVLPWAKAEATVVGQTFSHTTNGLSGDGKITLVLALVAGLVFLFLRQAKVTGALVLAAGVLAGFVALADIVDVGNKADDLRQITSKADATVGIGLWIVALAAIVLIAGGALCLAYKQPAPDAAPDAAPEATPDAPPAT